MSTPSASLASQSVRALKYLTTRAERDGLVLFVGSGISAGLVPMWNDLLDKLLESVLAETAFEDQRIHACREPLEQWIKSHFEVCAKASLIKEILGPDRYRAEVRNELYKKCSDIRERMGNDFKSREDGKRGEKDFDAIWHVASLCSCRAVRAVATFNFETLLETALECLGKRAPRPHCGKPGMCHTGGSGEKDLPIFYLHGRLLPPSSLVRDPRAAVVFSFDEYFDNNADALSWETTTPLHLLRSFCSLWLGASMTDWNMLRLLYTVNGFPKKPHAFCLQSLKEPKKAEETKDARETREGREWAPHEPAAMRFQATLLKSVGVKLIVAGAEYSDVWQVLAEHVTHPLPKYG